MVARLRPSPQFAHATFDSYEPDPAFPSQASTRDALAMLVKSISKGSVRRVAKKVGAQGVYLDGGFGVGKTHLLAAAWHAASEPKAFGTFIEYTSIVGALGFLDTVELFRPYRLVCIDEFELDDPGDTLIMVRLLGELAAGGTSIVATSNTPPGALGEGRFAARDFFREIQSIASLFVAYQIDGHDYRRRTLREHMSPRDNTTQAIAVTALEHQGARIGEDTFDTVIELLRRQHPVTYSRLAEQVNAVWWHDVHPFTDQNDALRFVALVDRLYDTQVAIVSEGAVLESVFPPDMLSGGFEKKYRRALSRLAALDALAWAGMPVS